MEYTPHDLAVKRRKLALEYKDKMKQLAEIKKKKALAILEILPNAKSIKHAEMIYDCSEDGQEELELTYYLKGLIEVMRSLKTEIDVAQGESYGQF